MFRTRKVALALILGAVLAACSSSSDNSGENGAGGTGGSGGGTKKNACSQTKCEDLNPIPDSVCSQYLAGPCAGLAMAFYACALANDECVADGSQNHSKVLAACSEQQKTYISCLAPDGGTK